MTKEGFSAWFKETFHKEDCLNNTVFTRQSLIDAWDNGYNKGKEELKEKLTKAKEIIKDLLTLHNDSFGQTKLSWRCNVIDMAEQFIEEVE